MKHNLCRWSDFNLKLMLNNCESKFNTENVHKLLKLQNLRNEKVDDDAT